MEEWRVRWLGWPKEPEGFDPGKCVACGLLGKRTESLSPARLEELPASERHPTERIMYMSDGAKATPWCLIRAADLPGEIRQYDQWSRERVKDAPAVHPPVGSAAWVSISAHMVLGRPDRRCEEWFPYYEFLSPVEHREMRDMMRLEEERKAHATKLAEMELKVQENSLAIAKELKAVQEGLAATADKTDRFTTRWTRVAVGLALASLVIVLVSYFLPHLGAAIAAGILGASPVPLP